MAGCHLPAGTKSSVLLLRSVGTAASKLAVWRWRGEATVKANFGDPTRTTFHTMCLYSDVGGVPSLVMESQVPPLGDCANRQPCWRQTTKNALFIDRQGQTNGVRVLYLISGETGRAKIIAVARGALLNLPTIPLVQDPTVTLQLQNGTGNCWESRFTYPARLNRVRGASQVFLDWLP
jgi:hypothetical protein